MPKQKTKRSAAKRYKLTATGKVKIKKANLRHILTKRSRNIKRETRKAGYLAGADERKAKTLVPYL